MNEGKLYFGCEESNDMKMAYDNLFEVAKKFNALDDGFCFGSYICHASLTIVDFQRVD